MLVAFLAGIDVVLDEWELAQPIVACTMVGMALGDVASGVLLGAQLQLIAIGWMNIGSAIPPDAALASIISAVLVCGPANLSIANGIAIAIPLAIAGQVLNIFVRSIVVIMAHVADGRAADGDIKGVQWIHYFDMFLQGLRIAIPTYIVTIISPKAVQAGLNAIPKVITQGLSIAGGFVVVVGFAMVINMMANNEVWPFFFAGFVLAALTQLNLIAFGILGLVIAFVYIRLSPRFNAQTTVVQNANDHDAASGSAEDDIDKALDDL
jgi:PTS system mannose-specific IIC component